MVLRGLNCRGCWFFERFFLSWRLVWAAEITFIQAPARAAGRPPPVVHVPMHYPPPARAAGLCALGGGRRCAGLGVCDGPVAHRLAREREAVIVLYQPVQHRISNRGVPNPFVQCSIGGSSSNPL